MDSTLHTSHSTLCTPTSSILNTLSALVRQQGKHVQDCTRLFKQFVPQRCFVWLHSGFWAASCMCFPQTNSMKTKHPNHILWVVGAYILIMEDQTMAASYLWIIPFHLWPQMTQGFPLPSDVCPTQLAPQSVLILSLYAGVEKNHWFTCEERDFRPIQRRQNVDLIKNKLM